MKNKYVTQSFDYLRGIPSLLAELFKSHAERQLRIRNKERLPFGASQNDIFKAETDKKNELEALKTETLEKLADIIQTAKTRQESAEKHLDRELGMRVPADNVTENLLIETREQKAWARIKPLLDRHSEIEALTSEIKTLVSGFINPKDDSPGAYDMSDYDSVSALKKELPFYIKGRFSPRESDIYIEQSINALEDALAAVRPEYREAVNIKKEMRAGMQQINLAFIYVRDAVENNEPEVLIPIWEKNEVATLK